VTLAGYKMWVQSVGGQTDEQQDAAMDAACKSQYGNSARAAFHSELKDGLIKNLPGTNGSGSWALFKCPNCEGNVTTSALSGHCRECVDNGKVWPTDYHGTGWNHNCCTNDRSTVCVIP